jgi:hypothetical protein
MAAEPDPIYRLDGLPDSASSYVDTQGDLVIPSMVSFNQRFYNETQFLGGVVFDSVSVTGLESITTIGNVDVGGDLEVTGDVNVNGALELSSGTRVNSISTGVGDPGTDDVLVTEAAVRSFVEAYVAQSLQGYATQAYSDGNAVWAKNQAIASSNAYTDAAIAALPSPSPPSDSDNP